jgi:DNA-binding MarR family transcriptional regulator
MTPDNARPEALDAARAVRRGVTRLAWRLRRLRAKHGVSAAKLALLGRLKRAGGPLPAVALARQESLQPQSLTRLIADLDRRGLIERHAAPDDGRQRLITLTDAGRQLLMDDARHQDLWLAGVMTAALTPTEKEILRLAGELLMRLSDVGPGLPFGSAL